MHAQANNHAKQRSSANRRKMLTLRAAAVIDRTTSVIMRDSELAEERRSWEQADLADETVGVIMGGSVAICSTQTQGPGPHHGDPELDLAANVGRIVPSARDLWIQKREHLSRRPAKGLADVANHLGICKLRGSS